MNKKISVHSIIQLLIILSSIILSVYFYQIFPARVPIHWDISGEVNGWGSKSVGAFLLPAILILIYFLFDLLPKIDPRKENYPDFEKAYAFFKTTIMAVLFGIYVITSLNVIGFMVSVSFWVPVLIGLLFIVLGNYLGKIRNNYFVGIRTPWTLANEETWNKTHRLGGKLFVLGGVLFMFMDFMPVSWRLAFFIAVIFLIVAVPIIYSYLIYKKQPK